MRMEPRKEDKEKLSEEQEIKQGGGGNANTAQESTADAELESGMREERHEEGSVSIGMPVSQEELRRLKERAEKKDTSKDSDASDPEDHP